MSWTFAIFNTETGEPKGEFEVSAGSWESGLTGQGRGSHTIPLIGQDFDTDWIREVTKGNKYTICQLWGSTVAYAGVIQRRRYNRAARAITVDSAELRVAYMDSRMLYGVFSYDPRGVTLQVSGKSRSGAARAVIDQALTVDTFWGLPIDLPADGSGGFSAKWYDSERLTWEDHLAQIEADGCEIFFRPYLDGDGWLRWETVVEVKVTYGSTTDLSFDDEDTPLEDVTVTIDYAREMTGILGFGKGGTAAEAYGFSPGDGADQISVRDMWVSFPDISGTRLESAVQALDFYGYPITQWSFGMSVYPDGPAFVLPGRRLDFTVDDDSFLPDDTYEKRVVAVRGDVEHMVTVEVQDA